MLTQASTKESDEALIKMLTDKDPLESVKYQTQDLRLNSNVLHPVAYISGVSIEANVDGLQLQRNVLVSLCQ